MTPNTKIYLSLFILLFFNIFTWQKVYSNHTGLQDTIHFLDVGQGSATLIQTSNSYQILIDAGPDKSILSQLSQIMPTDDNTIELAILTHPHADHLIGFNYLLENYEIKAIMFTDVVYNEENYAHLKKLVKEENIIPVIATQYTDIKINDIYIDILYPFASIQNENFEELNNSSLAIKLISPTQSIIITGDLHEEKEKEIVEHYDNYLQSDILVAGHHGSKTSSSESFLNMVNPQTVIISAGQDNKFGHPSPETIDKLTQKNIEIRRTDLDGSIFYKL